MYTIKSLINTGNNEITTVFNEAFADYIIPLSLTEEQLAEKIKAENIELALSAATFL